MCTAGVCEDESVTCEDGVCDYGEEEQVEEPLEEEHVEEPAEEEHVEEFGPTHWADAAF